MSRVKLLFSVMLAFSVLGCSIFQSPLQMINIKCVPDRDVVLTVNGKTSKCPTEMEVERDKDLLLQARKDGFKPYERTIKRQLSDTGKLDTLGFILILVPGLGLLTPGAWGLEELDINIMMTPK